jgi:hypothetical protein
MNPMNKQDLQTRHVFIKCYHGQHKRCPGWRYVDVYKDDPKLGRIRVGREKIFCECRCHARK